ncbi:MAG: M48 family metallopeptidase [Motiliproteus sp.]|nr:M48 family metallopeptidase [Motiliproteus sp.]MCW9053101.1 M48 family metallopeptidase [Motiliproteus sp.]
MDFFSQQDKARRNTGVLVLLFLVAVLLLIAITNLLVVLTLWSMDTTPQGGIQGGISALVTEDSSHLFAQMDWERFWLIGLAVAGVVLCAIIYKWVQLSEGGKRIAESLGGERIHPNTEDGDEKKILNVVEEMAIASGMPVPPVYLMRQEYGINAFAAGNTPADAVVGVTLGSIQRLNREQLQGVVAHEFSHILNGDMRLNLRLIAILHGIVFIGTVGELLLRVRPSSRSSSRRGGGAQVAILGLALIVVGWMGTFFGNLIRSSVSRQREFLADASAVQFTRNPDGIADALKVIGGHSYGAELAAPRTGEVSHLFFGRALKGLTGLFATHPPLLERIARIQPEWDGNYIYPKPSELKAEQERVEKEELKRQERQQKLMQAAVLGAAIAGEKIDPAELTLQSDIRVVRQGLDQIPESLQTLAREPLGAMALVFGFLQSDDEATKQKQHQYLAQSETPGLLSQIEQIKPLQDQLPRALHHPLLELTLPALKCMSKQQYQQFKQQLLLVMRADNHIDLYEWCLYQLLSHYLDPEYGRVKASKPKYRRPQQVADEFQLVLSLLVHHGHDDPEDAEKAFNRGVGSAGLYNLKLLPEPQCDLDQFKKAVSKLACCYPILKPRLIKGMENCVRQDGKVTVLEKEMLTCIAAVMDSPIPQLDD